MIALSLISTDSFALKVLNWLKSLQIVEVLDGDTFPNRGISAFGYCGASFGLLEADVDLPF